MGNNNLLAYIKKAGMTQKDLADRIGCTYATMCRYVSGDRIPRATTALVIADVLDTTVGAIWGGMVEDKA